MTLTLYPAFSTVGLRVLRRVAPVSLDIEPTLSSSWGSVSGLYSTPNAAQAAAMNSSTAGVSRTGQSWRPIRATVSASSVIALSGCSMEPCPAVPCAVSRIQAMPFSAIWTTYRRRPASVTLNPPTSPIASLTPSNRSGWLSTSHRAP